MPRDKQLRDVSLDAVLEKRRLEQALNAKEFAVLAGISYSVARNWFRLPGFPLFRGVVFWQDFVRWRTAQTRFNNLNAQHSQNLSKSAVEAASQSTLSLPARAFRILDEVT